VSVHAARQDTPVEAERKPSHAPYAPDVGQPLLRAMTTNPALHVRSSCGYYDLVCSYFANEQLAAPLDPAMKSRVQVRNYGGAHAVYTDDTVRLALKRDAATFLQGAVKR
jgi:carboxypeptidase C (cathepsin A)